MHLDERLPVLRDIWKLLRERGLVVSNGDFDLERHGKTFADAICFGPRYITAVIEGLAVIITETEHWCFCRDDFDGYFARIRRLDNPTPSV